MTSEILKPIVRLAELFHISTVHTTPLIAVYACSKHRFPPGMRLGWTSTAFQPEVT